MDRPNASLDAIISAGTGCSVKQERLGKAVEAEHFWNSWYNENENLSFILTILDSIVT